MNRHSLTLATLLLMTACHHNSMVAGVTVEPTAAALKAPGQTITIKATARDDHGNVVSHPTFVWKSDHPEIATVDSSGEIRAVKNGRALVSATSGPVSGIVEVTVGDVAPAAQPPATQPAAQPAAAQPAAAQPAQPTPHK